MRIKQITQKLDEQVNFKAPLLTMMYTDPKSSFWFVSGYLKNTSQQNLDTENLRRYIP